MAEQVSPQDLLMEAVCCDDVAVAIPGIDAAIATGANFSDDFVQPLFFAAFSGQTEIVRHLLARGATIGAEWPTNSQGDPGPYGDTGLHAAAERGDIEIVRMLLAADGKQYLEVFGLGSGWRLTPLGMAATSGHLEMVRVLVAAGANINANDEASAGETPLCVAVQVGHVEVVRFLLNAGADPTITGWMRLSAKDRAERGDGGEEIRQLMAARSARP